MKYATIAMVMLGIAIVPLFIASTRPHAKSCFVCTGKRPETVEGVSAIQLKKLSLISSKRINTDFYPVIH